MDRHLRIEPRSGFFIPLANRFFFNACDIVAAREVASTDVLSTASRMFCSNAVLDITAATASTRFLPRPAISAGTDEFASVNHGLHGASYFILQNVLDHPAGLPKSAGESTARQPRRLLVIPAMCRSDTAPLQLLLDR